MGDARSEDERLPWLDTPRAPKPAAAARKAPPKAARRARAPIFVLLSLFLVASVGMISYLAGRGSVAITAADRAPPPAPSPAAQATVTLPAAPAPPPPTRVAANEVRPAEAPRAVPWPQAAERRASPQARPRAARPTPKPRTVSVAMVPERSASVPRRAAPPPPRYVMASNVVQFGVYRNRRSAYAAYRRLERAYPYLSKLPRMVRRTTAPAGAAAPRTYRLQMRTYSPEHARILCQNLRSIGRGCAVLPRGR